MIVTSALWIGGLLLTTVGFILGKVFNQSEAILAEKRRIYEEFLRTCPVPSLVHLVDEARSSLANLEKLTPPLLLYASPNVVFALSRYLGAFQSALVEVGGQQASLHPAFKKAAKAHNDLILEMSRDALAWSAFGYRGKSRIPADALEQAKKKSLD